MAFRDLLEKKLTKKEMSLVPSAFDIIGNKEKSVAIVEIPVILKEKKKLIAHAIMEQHKNIKTVLDKGSPRGGKYRLRRHKIIAGSLNTEVTHKESGCSFRLDPRKVYFSGRESTERERIANMVKKDEDVMVFFAGAGPFPIVISKHSDAKKITGIELNPTAVRYFKENIKLNKVKNVEAIKGDVKKKMVMFGEKFDRIIMPLPETSVEYLNQAFYCSKKGGIVHLYFFSFGEKIADINKIVKYKAFESGVNVRTTRLQKVLPYGPGIWKMRLDIQVI